MPFSRPALRMVLNGALAVDWTVVHHRPTSLAGTYVETRAIARILCRGPGQARLPFSPPDTRGWRARGRCRRRFNIRISLRRCGSASRRATRTVFHCPGSFAVVFFRFAAHVVNGIPAPGRAFRCTVLIGLARSEAAVASAPCGLPSLSDGLSGKTCGQASTAAPSASSWQAARIGHQAEPRRRPSAWEERSSPARGRRILLHHQTPHDDAPRSSRTPCE